MPFHFSSIFKGLGSTSLFRFLGRYFYPELLMAGIYLLLWIDPFLFGEKGFEGLNLALWLEFVLAHAGTGMGVVGLFFPKKGLSRRVALSFVSAFYFLFVGGICWITGNIFSAIAFVVLSFKRTIGSHSDSLGHEIVFSFIKVMILILAGAMGFLAASVFPAAIENVGEEKGAEIVPAWGCIYFICLHFFELKRPNYLRRKQKKPVVKITTGSSLHFLN